MSETNKINTYANIKQNSNSDLRLPPRQIVAEKDEQVSTLNQNVINLSFKIDQANKAGFQLFVDGQLFREGSSNDYTFTSIQADNFSSQITLNSVMASGLNIIAQKLGIDKEVSPSLSNLQAELARRKVYSNYITNGTFEYMGTIGWNLYNDASQFPVDGLGGTVNANVTFAISQINPLRGANSAVLSKDAANRQGHGVATDIQIDLADCNKMLAVRMDVRSTSNYQAGYAKLYVYDKLNNTLLVCVPVEIPSNGQALASFPSTNSTQYRLIIHIDTATTTAWDLTIDDVQLGQPDLIFGLAGSDWTVFPMVITSSGTSPTRGTVTYELAVWRRVGDSMEIRFDYKQSTAGTAGTGVYYYGMPVGYQIDTTKVIASGNDVGYSIVGSGMNLINPAKSNYAIWPKVVDANKLAMTTTYTNSIDLQNSTDTPFGRTDGAMSFCALVPIVNWDSSIQLSTSKVEYAFNSDTSNGDNTSSFAYGAVGTFIGSYTSTERQKRVRFATPVQQTDHIFLEVQENGNWEKLSDHELNPQNQGSIRYGIRVKPVSGSTTDYDVFFGDGGGTAGPTYTGAGLAWSNFITLKWRLVKSANALAVEADVAPLDYQKSLSSGAFSTSSASPVAVTNMSVPVENKYGRKWRISFQSDGSGNNAEIGAAILSASVVAFANFIIKRNGTSIATHRIGGVASSFQVYGPPGSMNFIDDAAPLGTNTYTLEVYETDNGAGAQVYAQYMVMVLEEMSD